MAVRHFWRNTNGAWRCVHRPADPLAEAYSATARETAVGSWEAEVNGPQGRKYQVGFASLTEAKKWAESKMG